MTLNLNEAQFKLITFIRKKYKEWLSYLTETLMSSNTYQK